MKWQEQKREFEKMVKELDELLTAKGREYAGPEDALGNFKRAKYGLTPMQKLGTYLDKHMAAIESYIVEGKEFSDEPIEGRINDAINYLFLLRCIVVEAKGKKMRGVQPQVGPQLLDS